LKIEVKLLLSANRKSYTCVPHRLAEQRMTLNDLEYQFHTSCIISVVAKLLVCIVAWLLSNFVY